MLSTQAAAAAGGQGRGSGLRAELPDRVLVGYYSFSGWKDSLLGDHHAHGPEAYGSP
ncbi:MAG: hypothetical protein Q4G45_11870 [Actinomycetia bacterium]|nr:hypothetical protein [Actinomycetes bacterium]